MFYESTTSREKETFSHPLIVNNTFIENSAEYGGAIYSMMDDEFPVVFNSIFWKDTAVYSKDIYNLGGSALPVYNNIIDTGSILTPWMGEGNLNCDPTFMNDTLHLHWNSDCLNSGREMLTFNEVDYYCPEKDIDGDPRPYEDTSPDIGADEAPYLYVASGEQTAEKDKSLRVLPNPFTNSAVIGYHIEKATHAELLILNENGRLMQTLAGSFHPKGQYQLTWYPGTLPAGIYHCVLRTEKTAQSVKVIKLK